MLLDIDGFIKRSIVMDRRRIILGANRSMYISPSRIYGVRAWIRDTTSGSTVSLTVDDYMNMVLAFRDMLDMYHRVTKRIHKAALVDISANMDAVQGEPANSEPRRLNFFTASGTSSDEENDMSQSDNSVTSGPSVSPVVTPGQRNVPEVLNLCSNSCCNDQDDNESSESESLFSL